MCLGMFCILENAQGVFLVWVEKRIREEKTMEAKKKVGKDPESLQYVGGIKF